LGDKKKFRLDRRGTILPLARPSAFQNSRSVCGFAPLPPGKSLLASPKADEIATAELAAISSRSHAKKQSSSHWHTIELLRPSAQLQAQTLGAVGIYRKTQVPDGRRKALGTLAAAEGKNPEEASQFLRRASSLRTLQTTSAAARAV